MSDPELVTLTARLVAAYLGNNPLTPDEIPDLIKGTYTALATADRPALEPASSQPPVVPVDKSVKRDAIICLECGKPLKTAKRHIEAVHGLTPDQYRAKWSLAADYPMIARSYRAARSEAARRIGLGRPTESGASLSGSTLVDHPPVDQSQSDGPTAAPEGEMADHPSEHRHHYPASRWAKSI